MGLLPEKASFASWKIVDDIKKKLSFNEKELAELEIKEVAGRVEWKVAADKGVEVELGEFAVKMIADALKKLDSEEQLEARHYSIYEKFVK